MLKLLRRPEVLAITGIGGTSTLYDWMDQGEFPRPVALGARAVAWRESDVLAWINSRKPRDPDRWTTERVAEGKNSEQPAANEIERRPPQRPASRRRLRPP